MMMILLCIFKALEEIQSVFTHELAYQSFISFTKFVGEETMQRSLKNYEMLKELSEKHENQARMR